MFTRAEIMLNVGFATAASRLARVTQNGWLTSVSEGAYDSGLTGLTRVGPLGGRPGISKLVRVDVRDVVTREHSAVLTLRWEATGPGGALFPALDADITLTPTGDQSSRLTLDGAYRPPLAGLGAGLDKAILRHVASATVQALLSRVASAISQPDGQAEQVQGC